MKLEPVSTFDINELDGLKVAEVSVSVPKELPILYVAEPVYNTSLKKLFYYSEWILGIITIISLIHMVIRAIVYYFKKSDDDKKEKKFLNVSVIIFLVCLGLQFVLLFIKELCL